MQPSVVDEKTEEKIDLEEEYSDVFGKYLKKNAIQNGRSNETFSVFSVYKPMKLAYSAHLER